MGFLVEAVAGRELGEKAGQLVALALGERLEENTFMLFGDAA